MGVVRALALAHRKLRCAGAVGAGGIRAAGMVRLKPDGYGAPDRAAYFASQQSSRVDRELPEIHTRAISELERAVRSGDVRFWLSFRRPDFGLRNPYPT